MQANAFGSKRTKRCRLGSTSNSPSTMYEVVLSKEAIEDYRELKHSHNAAFTKRIDQMLHQLEDTPTQGIGQPEPLKHQRSGYWSRRIDRPNRLVYRIDDETMTVRVESLIGHYED